jgi:hypothetical protein
MLMFCPGTVWALAVDAISKQIATPPIKRGMHSSYVYRRTGRPTKGRAEDYVRLCAAAQAQKRSKLPGFRHYPVPVFVKTAAKAADL